MSNTRKVAVSETGRTTRTVSVIGDVRPEHTAAIRRPQVAKRPWRTEGEPFDPAKVAGAPSTTR